MSASNSRVRMMLFAAALLFVACALSPSASAQLSRTRNVVRRTRPAPPVPKAVKPKQKTPTLPAVTTIGIATSGQTFIILRVSAVTPLRR